MEQLEILQSICKDKRTLEMARYLINNSYIRVVNYHNTRRMHAERFETEVAEFAKHYVPVTIEDLDRFFETREWPYEKPGLIPAVYEGWRTHYDVYAPILDKYNFRGWFFVPAFMPDIPVEEQIPYSTAEHHLRMYAAEDYDDPRCIMTWDEIRDLSKRHEICCHTGTHAYCSEVMEPEELRREIVDSKKRLEEQIGKEVSVFCWCGGDEYNKAAYAHKPLQEAGYKYLISNLKMEKIR